MISIQWGSTISGLGDSRVFQAPHWSAESGDSNAELPGFGVFRHKKPSFSETLYFFSYPVISFRVKTKGLGENEPLTGFTQNTLLRQCWSINDFLPGVTQGQFGQQDLSLINGCGTLRIGGWSHELGLGLMQGWNMFSTSHKLRAWRDSLFAIFITRLLHTWRKADNVIEDSFHSPAGTCFGSWNWDSARSKQNFESNRQLVIAARQAKCFTQFGSLRSRPFRCFSSWSRVASLTEAPWFNLKYRLCPIQCIPFEKNEFEWSPPILFSEMMTLYLA